MFRMMVMNGVLISLICIWTSAAREPSAGRLIKSPVELPKGPLTHSLPEPRVSLNDNPMESRRRRNTCRRDLDGKCVRNNRKCPGHLPSGTSSGKPYCSKRRRCCYQEETSCNFNSTQERNEFSKLWPGRCPEKATECELNWVDTFKGLRPLVLTEVVDAGGKKTYHIQLPIKETTTDPVTTKVSDGSKLIFSCSGVGNKFTNPDFPKKKVLEAKCNSGKLTVTIAQKADLTKVMADMGCVSKITPTIDPLKGASIEKCGGSTSGGKLYHIAFETFYDDFKYYNLIDVCFEEPTRQTTLWTRHTLHGRSNLVPVTGDRPTKWKDNGMFSLSKDQLHAIYTSVQEKALLTKILQDSSIANGIINEALNKWFNKGHLSPNADFPTKAERDATFFFVNAVPQYAIYNAKNWETVEDQVRKLAVKGKTDLEIITGATNVLQLKDKNDNLQDIFLGLTYTQTTVPIPQLMWKIVIKYGPTKKAVAFVTYNYPYVPEPTASPCNGIATVCDKLTWIPKNIMTQLAEFDKGKTFCCEVKDLTPAQFPNVPTGILPVVLLTDLP